MIDNEHLKKLARPFSVAAALLAMTVGASFPEGGKASVLKNDPSARSILLTGAAGGIGSAFFRSAADHYSFRLADLARCQQACLCRRRPWRRMARPRHPPPAPARWLALQVSSLACAAADPGGATFRQHGGWRYRSAGVPVPPPTLAARRFASHRGWRYGQQPCLCRRRPWRRMGEVWLHACITAAASGRARRPTARPPRWQNRAGA
jgi:hypothetical protein